MQEFEPAIARGEQRALKQHGADAMALPRLLDRECRFRLARDRRSDRAQLGGAAQRALDEEPVNDRVDAE